MKAQKSFWRPRTSGGLVFGHSNASGARGKSLVPSPPPSDEVNKYFRSKEYLSPSLRPYRRNTCDISLKNNGVKLKDPMNTL
ncbi:hypothetical protein CHS0354_008687 [Potamilus streckersoni]|uniref:Uncharacterized protein n=1 Tax=Potamilus streckersoni TaxID=2493646 RepID=A0AAE0TI51_9BIVA|nr:hypothetical protein CHS0354_008687 [Potamilus streckersoni]